MPKKGYKRKENIKKQISETVKLYWQTHEHPSKGKPSWNKGLKQPKETKDKISNTLYGRYRGEQNVNYKGGKYSFQLPGWSRIRKEAIARAGYKSELSGNNGGKLDVHHIISRRKFCDMYFGLMYGEILEMKAVNNLLSHVCSKFKKRLFLPLIYPTELFEEVNEPSNLIVLTHGEHKENEGQPQSFFEYRITRKKISEYW